MRYTLRQLEVFLATARTENITRAAESLAMSQSAASGALKELEQQFDVALFDRAGKRLKLNELGRVLLPRAQGLLEQAGELERVLAAHTEMGELKVGATLTIGNYLAVGIMARYMSEVPGVRVVLEVDNTAHIADAVLHFQLDIGLIEGEMQHPDLDVTPWRDDELVVFCSPQHPLAAQGRLDDEALLAATWIVREQGSGTRQTFDRAMHGLLPRMNILLELQHTEAIKRAVEAGLGIGCLSRVTLAEAFRRGSLVPLTVPERDFRRQFYFVLHRQKYRSRGIERWLELCQAM
ncbi:LysR family transcriptional regulator [Isoalcanivorax pacificus W11-5]|uniref:LysR family transcriptional regulator n=1 Tax=Isoalcanivorax pacificus W11-5 TaxID=391936 RepID=A0A0B4XMT0_9GAMM|nr:LysR family transcriptional regulator [Isoalcanivorax pacificus]AJD47833.1 LysR family transcriptional regulator [Isoalcanivorax pacificus W11-5]